MVLVEGELNEPKPYQKNDGTWGASLDVTAINIRFLGGREDGGTSVSHDDGGIGGVTLEDEEIPF